MRRVSIMIKFVAMALGLSATSAFCQSAFPTMGGDISGNGGSLSYTVGQLAVSFDKQRSTNAEYVKLSLFEGVQQTYSVTELSIDGVAQIAVKVNIAPNPTTDKIKVMLESPVDNLYFELYTMSGNLLQKDKFSGAEQIVDMSSLPSGSYLLRVVAEKMENNYRIIKLR